MCINKLIVNGIFFIKELYEFITYKREKKIGDILLKNSLKISVAESCTGGLLSSRLTDVSGSSAYIFQNFVTYANEAKINLLGVKEESVQEYGVVSDTVAQEMVQGLLSRYNCDIAVSVTGIAGPTGGSIEKPVGLVYIGIANKQIQKTFKFQANSNLNRRLMKRVFSSKVLNLLLEFLEKNYKS